MKWFKRQQKQGGVSIDKVVFSLINLSRDVVKDASGNLEKRLDAKDRTKLPEIQTELLCFFLFALDYWWQTQRAHTEEDKRIWGEIYGAHLRILFGGDPAGLAMWDTFQQRLISYGQIVNAEKGGNAKLGIKLSEFCGLPGNLDLLLLPASLFQAALVAVSSFRR